MEEIQRESMEYDVVIVGAGPSGLSTAIKIKQLANKEGKDISVCLVEKGSEVGAHILSGNVIDPKALNELLPNWKEEGAPLKTEVKKDSVRYYTKKFSARTGGAPGANFQQSDVAKKARGQADTQQVVDLYNSVFKSNVPDANFTQLPNMNFGNVIPVGSDMATRTAAAAGTGSMGEGQVLINYQPKNTSNQINSQNRTVVNPLDIILVDGF